MAELLIVVVAVVVVLLYAADRARKLRVRARQMAGMNERLDAAAAKIDKEQQRKRARVRASAELTSVMPAIKRPPLTLPGVPGPGDAAEKEAPPEAAPEAAGHASGAADGLPGPKTRVTSEGTLIMPSLPAQGPVPAGRGPAGTGHPPGGARLAPDTMWGAPTAYPAAYQERTDRR